MPLYRFTPDLMSYEELEKLTVGREILISEVLRRIENHAKKKIPIYLLAVGPRGIGKSHFLLSIYYRIRNDSRLIKTFHTIKLSEEEYSVTRLSDLFTRILEEDGIDVSSINDEETIIEHGIAHLKKLGKQKMPILLMDNVHMIFSQLSTEDLKRFRSILQEENCLMIVGTASSVFSELADYNEPFYDFFEIRFLKDLSTEEVKKLAKKKLEFEGQKDLVREFHKLEPRIKAISILTGGNPRLILMICDLLCRPEELTDIEGSLLGLLDELTPFYQARMEILPRQQRKIFDNLALASGPLSPTEIAARTRLEVNIVSVQLKRLERAGYVETIKLSRKKTTHYEIRERLFRIWREMRSPLGNKRILLFVRFLKMWYQPQELYKVYSELIDKMDKAIQDRLLKKMRGLAIHACYLQEAIGPPAKYRMFFSWVVRLAEASDFATIEKEIRDRKAISEKAGDRKGISMILATEAVMYDIKGESAKAIEFARAAVKAYPNNSYALLTLGGILATSGPHEALKYLELSIKKGKSQMLLHDANFAKASILGSLSKHQDALETIEQSIKLFPKCPLSLDLKSWILANLGETEEALRCNDRALEVDPEFDQSLLTRAKILSLANRHGEVLEQLNKYIEAKPTDENRLDEVAHVLLNIGEEKRALEIFQRSFRKAKEVNNAHVLTCSALHLINDRFRLSAESIIGGDPEKAEKLLEEALDLAQYVSEREEFLTELFLKYLVNVSQNGMWKSVDKILAVVHEKLGQEHLELFTPFFKAVEYIKTEDPDILESLQKEVRDVVVSLIETLAPQARIPKDA